jgi:FkbM family methyltransferase
VEPGSIAVDVGANIGVYTKVLAELVGTSGRVISIEPVPETFAILVSNVRSLAIGNVTALNLAVSDAEGFVAMEVPEYEFGGTNYYQAHIVRDVRPPGSVSRLEHVQTVTLDGILESMSEVGFVKCDVEGHELACLAGAESLLRQRRAAWLVEIAGDPDAAETNAVRVLQLFKTHSYRPWLYDGSCLTPRRAGDRSVNYFFLTDAHVARLRARAPGLMARGPEGSGTWSASA